MLIPALTVASGGRKSGGVQTASYLCLEALERAGDDFWIAETLWAISGTNRMLDLREEGIRQVKEALEIYERLNDISGQARCLCRLAYLLYGDWQLDAAERVALQVISHFSGKSEQDPVCDCYRLLGEICRSKGEKEKSIDHFKTALEIASSFNWDDQLCWIHHALANLFFDEGRFDDARAHVEHAKYHTTNDAYLLGWVVEL